MHVKKKQCNRARNLISMADNALEDTEVFCNSIPECSTSNKVEEDDVNADSNNDHAVPTSETVGVSS